MAVRWCDEGEPMNLGALTKESTVLQRAATRTRCLAFPVLLLHPRHGSTWEGHERLEHFLLLHEKVTAPLKCDEARRESEPKRERGERARRARGIDRSLLTSCPLLARSCCAELVRPGSSASECTSRAIRGRAARREGQTGSTSSSSPSQRSSSMARSFARPRGAPAEHL